jgi:hypothetical protein
MQKVHSKYYWVLGVSLLVFGSAFVAILIQSNKYNKSDTNTPVTNNQVNKEEIISQMRHRLESNNDVVGRVSDITKMKQALAKTKEISPEQRTRLINEMATRLAK